ncbi:MAG: hypothetical protein MPI95_04690 [Nitrosopumilus sp.]|nr:hypothetical protein [Nitrosopumilus sp.]MDA7953365.1 hypothetical protein [Nitrosopumilus sp.]MDA7958372.1 hypothetical protein [Nitrosopumilus sp.]MDA7999146.1 hypothetical protein [Nitrosopumilus sp.]
MVRVAIIDYGAGNIFSLKNSLERAGAEVDVAPSPGAGHAGLLLPGVGSFDPAMSRLEGFAEAAGDVVTASSDYGVPVPAVVEQGAYFGTQFHPEKSGEAGQAMLRNFLGVCRR